MYKAAFQVTHSRRVLEIYNILNSLTWATLWVFIFYGYLHTDNPDVEVLFVAALGICSACFLLTLGIWEHKSSQAISNNWYDVGLHSPLTPIIGLAICLPFFLKRAGLWISRQPKGEKKTKVTQPRPSSPKEQALAALKEPLADLEQAMSARSAQGAYRNQNAEEAFQRFKEAYKRASEK